MCPITYQNWMEGRNPLPLALSLYDEKAHLKEKLVVKDRHAVIITKNGMIPAKTKRNHFIGKKNAISLKILSIRYSRLPTIFFGLQKSCIHYHQKVVRCRRGNQNIHHRIYRIWITTHIPSFKKGRDAKFASRIKRSNAKRV